MTYRTGNMFLSPASLYLVTTNSTIRRDGALIMGKGAAQELTQRYPRCQYEFGHRISEYGGYLPTYNLLISSSGSIGIFQVKYYFRDKARIDLIIQSCLALREYIALRRQSGDTGLIHLNYPGILNGGLSKEEVGPVLDSLLGDVEGLVVWEKE